jgi:hypothetical protein
MTKQVIEIGLPKFVAERRHRMEETLQDTLKQADKTLLGILELNAAGFKTGVPDTWDLVYGLTVDMDERERTDFCKIHKAMGPLEQSGMEPEGDGRTRKVRVKLRPKDKTFNRSFLFTYTKVLPKPDKRKGKDNQPKCRLVTRTVKQTVLVCDKK